MNRRMGSDDSFWGRRGLANKGRVTSFQCVPLFLFLVFNRKHGLSSRHFLGLLVPPSLWVSMHGDTVYREKLSNGN